MKITRKNFTSVYPKGLNVSEIRKGFEETIELCDSVVLPMAKADWQFSASLFQDDALTEAKINEIIDDQLEVLNLLIDSDKSLLIVKAENSIDLRKAHSKPKTEATKKPKAKFPFPIGSHVLYGSRGGTVVNADEEGTFIEVLLIGATSNITIKKPTEKKDLRRMSKERFTTFEKNFNTKDAEPEKKDKPKPKPKPNPKSTPKPTPKPEPKANPKENPAPSSKPKPSPKTDDKAKPQPRSVNKISIAQKIAKRFLAMNGKPLQRAKIVNLLQEITKAANRRVFKLDTLNGEMMDYVQNQLLSVLKEIDKNPEKANKTLVFSAETLNVIQPIAFVQEANIIRLCNRYVQLADAQNPDLTGGKLLKDIEVSIQAKKLSEKHRLYPYLIQIKARLEQKRYAPTSAMLAGLKGFI